MNDNKKSHFIKQLVSQQLKQGVHSGIITRFPPEPNGYLHIGHAKSVCLNFGLALEFNGQCNLRFDDTNPIKEETEYVKAIIKDVKWLGFQWNKMTHSSDYYQELYDFAVYLIQQGKAYVDSLSMDEIKQYRGTLLNPGKESPYRNRSIDENLDLFTRMKIGEFANGSHVLRAKINMQSPNINLRDPVLYRIRHAPHQRTGNAWCIYPMYDYAHPISDALEYITHSLCTLEFQDHRPLYDWLIKALPLKAKPVQTEFARLNLSHTVTSKRKLRQLVEQGVVQGWDDPRLPTIQGMRKRGYPASSIRDFCDIIGISKSDSIIDISILEECVRNDLNKTCKRALAIFNPLKIVITNYPADKSLSINAPYYPNDSSSTRVLPFEREIYIEKDDFMAHPKEEFFRLALDREVRLRHAYIIRCNEIIYDVQGQPLELHCTFDAETLGKNPLDRKVKGVIHWIACSAASEVTVYQYDRLFLHSNPGSFENFLAYLNPNSLQTAKILVEPALLSANLGETFQFERLGYYQVNQVLEGKVKAFHRIVELRSSWDKIK